tara:strand:+ start:87 stop:227 length:141 start_codon:yes stop_codon:yes gene_type:complete
MVNYSYIEQYPVAAVDKKSRKIRHWGLYIYYRYKEKRRTVFKQTNQ